MARTPRELQKVTGIARHVRGVKRVVSYVEVRPGAPVTAAASVPVASGPPPVTPLPPGPAAPRTTIEVEKL
jgi:hypothetical protein